MVILKSKKHVFWEALVITIAIFLIGLFIGMLIETGNSNKISNLYLRSEIGLVDGTATLQISEDSNISCESIMESNINFANKIYDEAKLLEEYDASGKLSDNIKLLHKKYDLLRTLLWISNQNTLKKCDNFDLIVYLYEYETEDTTRKATQKVWSRLLLDIKLENENMLLIPIAADQELSSLDLLMNKYNITQFPAVVLNNKKVLYNLDNLREELN